MKGLLSIIALTLLLGACQQHVNSEMELKMKKTNSHFKKAKCNFPSNDQFYILNHFQFETMTDTLNQAINQLFTDPIIASEINVQVGTWLKDSVFIFNADKRGMVLFDKTNLELLEDPLQYYMNEKFDIDFEKTNSSLQTLRSMFQAKVNGHVVHFEIIPTNGKLIQHIGEYVIVSTGTHQSKNTKTASSWKSIQRFNCDLLKIDWFIKLSSDYYFEEELSIQMTDTTLYYDSNWKGKLID